MRGSAMASAICLINPLTSPTVVVQAKAFQAGVYTVLPLSNTDQIFLYNVQPFQFTANDFIFE
jgi:hypothetical protein